ncbi:MAG: hypothetical protein PHQ18_05325 [Patescibacteria group bacterium]|nr:hypothetical protein [Patescibacteria group bacterium]
MTKEKNYNNKSILALVLALSGYFLPYSIVTFHNSTLIVVFSLLSQTMGIIAFILGLQRFIKNKKDIFSIIAILFGIHAMIIFIFSILAALAGGYSSNMYYNYR